MITKEVHKVTWFRRDEMGRWQWQGWKDELQTQDQIQEWYDELTAADAKIEAEGGTPREAFILDLETAGEMIAELGAAAQELEDLREWLDDVVQIEKITVETEFAEWQREKHSAGEDDEDDE